MIAVAWDGRAQGVIAVADQIKPTSREAILDLKRLGIEPVLITGDNERVAAVVAEQVGIARVLAGVLPDGKAAEIRRLQHRPARSSRWSETASTTRRRWSRRIWVLAIGTGANVAIEASDLTLVSGDLRAAGDAIRLARRTLRTIKGNLFWAFAYNVAAIPLAISGLLNPMVAAAAMSFSSVFVVTNSLRLRRFHSTRWEVGVRASTRSRGGSDAAIRPTIAET